MWVVFFFLSIFWYFFSWNYLEFKLSKKNFTVHSHYNWFDLLFKLFWTNPKCAGFAITYHIFKALKKKNLSHTNRIIILKNLGLTLLLGVNLKTLNLSCQLSADISLYSFSNLTSLFLELPGLILNRIYFLNSFVKISEKLRLYKNNWEVEFNPNSPRSILAGNPSTLSYFNSGTLISHASNRDWRHPALLFDHSGDKIQTAVQLTGTPLIGMHPIQIKVNGYKKESTSLIINMLMDKSSLKIKMNTNILNNLGIFDNDTALDLHTTIWAHRTFIPEMRIWFDFDINAETRELVTSKGVGSYSEMLLQYNDDAQLKKLLNISLVSLKKAEQSLYFKDSLPKDEISVLTDMTNNSIIIDYLRQEWREVDRIQPFYHLKKIMKYDIIKPTDIV